MSSDLPSLNSKEIEILRLLVGKAEMYGLEMVKASDQLKRGTVYVTLSRMSEKGYVEGRYEDVVEGDGPPRRLYRATGLGRRVFRAWEAANSSFRGGVPVWGY